MSDPAFFDYGHYCNICEGELENDGITNYLYCPDCEAAELMAEESDEDYQSRLEQEKLIYKIRMGFHIPEVTYKA